MSRIPRRGVVNPLDSVSGFGARDGTPVHLFLLIIRPSGVGAVAFCFVLDVDIRSFPINFTHLFCSALESSVLFPVASLTVYCGVMFSWWKSKSPHSCRVSCCNQWDNSAPSFPDMSPCRCVVNAGKCHGFCGLFHWCDTPSAHKQNNLVFS